MRIAVLSSVLALLVPPAISKAAITFTPGHLYTTNYFSREIIEYNSSGAILGSITLPASAGDELRGLAFGPDGLLYTTAIRGNGFAVLALNSSGAVQQTYPMANLAIRGNISFGRLTLDGSSIYVAGSNQLTKFTRGVPTSGSFIYSNNQVFDAEVLPTGNLLVASAYEIQEITNTGTAIRTFPQPSPQFYTDIRGVEYDPITNKIFVTHLGHSDFFSRIMRIHPLTGAMEDNTTFNSPNDLFLLDSGNLLVGSSFQAPGIFNQALDQVGTLAGSSRIFVTQYPVPEPSGLFLLLLATPPMLMRRRTR